MIPTGKILVVTFGKQHDIFSLFIGEHKTPEFQKISPHGEVPVLVDGDVTVYGAVPILLYLGEKYTDFNRFGDTLKEKIKVSLAFSDLLDKF